MSSAPAAADSSAVTATLRFWPAEGPSIENSAPVRVDMRAPSSTGSNAVAHEVLVRDARSELAAGADLGLETSGFVLLTAASDMQDWLDPAEVMRVYYDECRQLAQQLTGAHTTFTYDHLIREPGRQLAGGGTDGSLQVTGQEAGGGYIGTVHMDYTDNTTWDQYLAVHGQKVPDAEHVVALNFWRPLCPVIEDDPLAVCDARSVSPAELHESVIYGYGAATYSWHNVGIETYSVKANARQRWYYYPRMTPDEVLVIRSFDSRGVIGRCCPHGSFHLGIPDATPRRSIELRVLCFC